MIVYGGISWFRIGMHADFKSIGGTWLNGTGWAWRLRYGIPVNAGSQFLAPRQARGWLSTAASLLRLSA